MRGDAETGSRVREVVVAVLVLVLCCALFFPSLPEMMTMMTAMTVCERLLCNRNRAKCSVPISS